MAEVYLTLGSNIQPAQHLPQALGLLAAATWLEVVAVSPIYETAPIGYTEQANFWNAALHSRTTLAPLQVKEHLLALEYQLGRVRDPLNKNAPRTIDLDIALWDSAVLTYGARPWTIPDPDILRFSHVARPLADLAPHYRHPLSGQTLAEIAASLPLHGLRRLDPT